jgi:hypothetical protein
VVALAIGEDGVDLQITCGGGVGALRALEGALEIEGTRKLLHSDVVARESRITLGPACRRNSAKPCTVRASLGPADLAGELANEIEAPLAAMGVTVELVTRIHPENLASSFPLRQRFPARSVWERAIWRARERL